MIETSLFIDGLTEGEEYEFRVFAQNAANRISLPSKSSGPITAKDEVVPARIDVDAEYRTLYVVKAGASLDLVGHVRGKPDPYIHWFYNGTELVDNNKCSIKVRFLNVPLTITNFCIL